MSTVALPLLVLSRTGSGAKTALVTALIQLPKLVMVLFAGALADRWDRRRIMLLSDLGRAALLGSVPLVDVGGGPTMAVLYAIAVPLGVLDALFASAYASCVPSLVGRPLIQRATATFRVVATISYVAGPALAGVLVGTLGPARTLAVDAASFVASASSLVFVRRPLQATRDPEDATKVGLVAQIREGLRFVLEWPALRSFFVLDAIVAALCAPLVVALPALVILERKEPPGLVGALQFMLGVGSIFGYTAAARARSSPIAPVVLGATAVIGAANLTLPLCSAYGMALPALVGGASVALSSTLIANLAVQATPERLLGRVLAVADLVYRAIVPLGVLAGGALVDSLGGGRTLQIMGSLSLAVTVGFALFARSIRDVRLDAPQEGRSASLDEPR